MKNQLKKSNLSPETLRFQQVSFSSRVFKRLDNKKLFLRENNILERETVSFR